MGFSESVKDFVAVLGAGAAVITAGHLLDDAGSRVESGECALDEDFPQDPTASTYDLCQIVERLGEVKSRVRVSSVSSSGYCPETTQSFPYGVNCEEIKDPTEKEDCKGTDYMQGCHGLEKIVPMVAEIEHAALTTIQVGGENVIVEIACTHERRIPVSNSFDKYEREGEAVNFEEEIFAHPESVIAKPHWRIGPFDEMQVVVNGGNENSKRDHVAYREDHLLDQGYSDHVSMPIPRIPRVKMFTDGSSDGSGIDGKLDGNRGDRGKVLERQRYFAGVVNKCIRAIRQGKVWREDPDTCSQPID